MYNFIYYLGGAASQVIRTIISTNNSLVFETENSFDIIDSVETNEALQFNETQDVILIENVLVNG